MHRGAKPLVHSVAPRISLLIALAGGVCALLGLVMLLAWMLGLTGQDPHNALMQADTALAIFLAGLGVAAQHTRPGRLTRILGIGVLLLAAASGLEYALARELPLNDFLFQHLLGFPSQQMAPNTALALIFIGLLQSLPESTRTTPSLHAFRFALAGSATALGLSSAVGYLSGQPALYGWGKFAAMPPDTAAALILLGVALLVADLLQSGPRGLRSPAILIAAIIGGATLLAWDGMKSAEKKDHHAHLAQLAATLAHSIDNDLATKASALERMAKRWETAGGTPRALWEADAQGYIADHGFKSLGWADAKGVLRWVVARPGNEAFANFDLEQDAQRLEALATTRLTHKFTFSPPLELIGEKGMVIEGVRALYVNHKLDGYIVAPIRLEKILRQAARPVLPAHARVSLKTEKLLLAQAGNLNGPAVNHAREGTQALRLLPGPYLQIEHDAGFLAAEATHLPALVLFTGLFAATLLGIALWFWQAALLRAQESEAAHAGIRDREARLAAIVDTAVEGIIIIDEHGVVESINPAAEKLFGYTSHEASGRNVSLLMPEPFRSQHDGYLQRYLGGGPARVIGIGREVIGLRKSGESFPMELAVSEMIVNGRRMFTGLARDISERKQMEQMKAEFVSMVSHELRTPLTSIAGTLGLAAGGALGELPAQARPMIDIALNNSRRLTHLINDLLDMEKMAVGKMQFDLHQQPLLPLVRETVAAIRAYADPFQVSLVLAEPPDDLQVEVDGNRLQQILHNLLSNAIKFSPQGGQVEIAVCRNGEKARVQITDHGPGIPAEFRSRIFQKFSQADSSDQRKTGGSGLGLAISRELAERMHGRVGFVSEEGHGASFFVEFPVQEMSANAGMLPPENRPRVLHVDDDDELFRSLSSLCSKIAGFEAARTLAEAREKLARNRYDLIVLDIVLPDGSGWDLLPQVKAVKPAPPVIVLSASELSGAQKAEVQAALVKTRSSSAEFLQNIERQLSPLL